MTTDTSEKGLESLIVADMTASGWIAGAPSDYDREYCVDMVQLSAFLCETQPEVAEALARTLDEVITVAGESNVKGKREAKEVQGEIETRMESLARMYVSNKAKQPEMEDEEEEG